MQNFSTIRLIVRRASQKTLRWGRIDPLPLARARNIIGHEINTWPIQNRTTYGSFRPHEEASLPKKSFKVITAYRIWLLNEMFKYWPHLIGIIIIRVTVGKMHPWVKRLP